MTVYDELVEWVSEKGRGSWKAFRQTYDWLTASEGLKQADKAYRAAFKLSTLGYLEVDWKASEWSVCPPLITLLPNAGAYGLVVGARTRSLSDALKEATDPNHAIDVVMYARAQPSGPSSWYLGGTDTSIAALAGELGIAYETSIADRLCALLPPFRSTLSATESVPPSDSFEVERWVAADLRWNEAASTVKDGLYRVRQYSRDVYRFKEQGQWHLLDQPTGMFAELRRKGIRVLRYRKNERNGTLFSPLAIPLPALQARTAALCTGLTPRVKNPTADFMFRRLAWSNVPLRVADRIAKSLGQELDHL